MNAVDSIDHFWFDCPVSAEYWSRLSPLLARTTHLQLNPPLHERDNLQIVLGIPHLRHALNHTERRAFRTFFAIAVQELYEAKWAARKGRGAPQVSRMVELVSARLERRVSMEESSEEAGEEGE